MAHRRAKLTVRGRELLVERVLGWMDGAVAAEAQACRGHRLQVDPPVRTEGSGGLHDRSSRPHRMPGPAEPEREAAILEREDERSRDPTGSPGRSERPTPRCIGCSAATGCPGCANWIVRRGAVVRYERERPGELIHVDIKKQGRIPDGGGWRVHGRGCRRARTRKRGLGYDFVHTAVDDRSRLAYAEILADERKETASAVHDRAFSWFAARGVTVERVLTDNGSCYRSREFANTLAEAGIAHRWTRPYRPQTNGKVERFNLTLKWEWAYARTYDTNSSRTEELDRWLHHYNYHRPHMAHAGGSPISALNNVPRTRSYPTRRARSGSTARSTFGRRRLPCFPRMERARVAAVVVAAGSGTRLGGEVPKALRTIGGRHVVAVAVDAALASPSIDAVVVVSPPGSEDAVRGMFVGASAAVIVVTGGPTRQRSVGAGLDAVGAHVEVVAVHDAARPFASPALFTAVVRAVEAGADAAVPVVWLVDTVKRVQDGSIVGTEPRDGLALAQTPQACRLDLLRAAIAKAEASSLDFTDDSGLMEWAGASVRTVDGEPGNIKITTASDLARADELAGIDRE